MVAAYCESDRLPGFTRQLRSLTSLIDVTTAPILKVPTTLCHKVERTDIACAIRIKLQELFCGGAKVTTRKILPGIDTWPERAGEDSCLLAVVPTPGWQVSFSVAVESTTATAT